MLKCFKNIFRIRKKDMKIIVTGANGQLGSDVTAQLKECGHTAVSADIPELDITDLAAVEAFFEKEKPDAVIHCAAYTDVDGAETDREVCKKVNAHGTENIAKMCRKHGAKLLYTSTDYVFDGKGTQPFEIDSKTSPCNYYGETKLMGENAVKENCEKFFIVRISWVFGKNGKNFVKTMLRLSKERDEISVVCDQTGSPTYTPDLAKLLCEMIETDKYGIYHATNENFCSWAEFAAETMRLAGAETKIIPVASSEYKTVAVRPLNSRMSKASLDAAGFSRLPDWQNALERFISQLC